MFLGNWNKWRLSHIVYIHKVSLQFEFFHVFVGYGNERRLPHIAYIHTYMGFLGMVMSFMLLKRPERTENFLILLTYFFSGSPFIIFTKSGDFIYHSVYFYSFFPYSWSSYDLCPVSGLKCIRRDKWPKLLFILIAFNICVLMGKSSDLQGRRDDTCCSSTGLGFNS